MGQAQGTAVENFLDMEPDAEACELDYVYATGPECTGMTYGGMWY